MTEVLGASQGRLAELIERLEKASGPDREIDARIFVLAERRRALNVYWTGAMGYPKELPEGFDLLRGGLGTAGIKAMAPEYTASIDAALTLVPGFASAWDCGRIDSGYCASVEFAVDVDGFHNHHGKSSANAATALCIAALHARQSSTNTVEEV